MGRSGGGGRERGGRGERPGDDGERGGRVDVRLDRMDDRRTATNSQPGTRTSIQHHNTWV